MTDTSYDATNKAPIKDVNLSHVLSNVRFDKSSYILNDTKYSTGDTGDTFEHWFACIIEVTLAFCHKTTKCCKSTVRKSHFGYLISANTNTPRLDSMLKKCDISNNKSQF